MPNKRTSCLVVITLLLLIFVGGALWLFLSPDIDEDTTLDAEQTVAPTPSDAIEITPALTEAANSYDELYEFSDGLAEVAKDRLYGFINAKGEKVIPCIYNFVEKFSEGLAEASKTDEGGSVGYINTNGEEVIPFIYSLTRPFSEGLAAVEKDDKWGCINAKGETVIPFAFDCIYSFNKGLASASIKDKWGYINKKGDIVIPCQYDEAWDFSDGLDPSASITNTASSTPRARQSFPPDMMMPTASPMASPLSVLMTNGASSMPRARR